MRKVWAYASKRGVIIHIIIIINIIIIACVGMIHFPLMCCGKFRWELANVEHHNNAVYFMDLGMDKQHIIKCKGQVIDQSLRSEIA